MIGDLARPWAERAPIGRHLRALLAMRGNDYPLRNDRIPTELLHDLTIVGRVVGQAPAAQKRRAPFKCRRPKSLAASRDQNSRSARERSLAASSFCLG